MIRLEGVHKHYVDGESRNHVLRGIDLAITEGEFVAIMGSSGSGKSTLLNLIGALDQGYQGDVFVAGQPLSALSDSALSQFRSRTVGFVFQQFHLLMHLPTVDNVMLPGYFQRADEPETASRVRATTLLERVGLGHKLGATPGQLSGGERQRVAIARALFNRPRVLLADEPTGALDRQSSGSIMALFEALNAESSITVIVVTHDAQVASRCHRVIRLVDGLVDTDEVTR